MKVKNVMCMGMACENCNVYGNGRCWQQSAWTGYKIKVTVKKQKTAFSDGIRAETKYGEETDQMDA